MPLFLRTREPSRQERLILGGAVLARPRLHRLHAHRYRMPHRVRLAKPRVAAKPVAAKPVAAKAPKRARRRGVPTQRRHRPSARKQHQTPLPQRRRQLQQRGPTPARRKRPATQLSKKAPMRKGKRPQPAVSSSSSTAKKVLNQLTNSRQIQRAMKGVVADVNLPQTGRQLINQVVSSAATKPSRKRPVEEILEEAAETSPAKRARFPSSFSPIGYRGKKIHRGGTKQQHGGGYFLF